MIRLTSLFIALLVWLGAAVLVSMRGFANASAPVVALTVWGLTAGVLLLVWIIPLLRTSIDRLPLVALLGIHLCRFVGVYFLLLGNERRLPRDFAVPAGIGDIIVAIGAMLLLLSRGLRARRAVMLGWNVTGLIDIVFVVFNALRCGLRDWSSMAPLRQLPLSLLPTFIVPLILVSHVVIFARLGRERS